MTDLQKGLPFVDIPQPQAAIPKRLRVVTGNDPGKHFLRFTELYLSGGKCDIEHNRTVSFNNCLLHQSMPGRKADIQVIKVQLLQAEPKM